jgi:hypothetical protein
MMLDPAPLSTQPALASRHNGPFEVEILRGHFFRLDLFECSPSAPMAQI